MKIAIYGLGYVGLTAAACLTKEGHSVVGIDVSEKKVREIGRGESPIEEPGLEDLLKQAVADGRLTCTTDSAAGVVGCDMAIVCVGTPSGPEGSHNMTYIAEVSRQIAVAVAGNLRRESPLTVVYRSTIRPGTIENLITPIFEASLRDAMSAIEIVYNPEFLREATAIKDYFEPPKIVIGTFNGEPSERMGELYKSIQAPTFYTRFGEAEFTKFVDNTFHALKVGFANEIGRICLQLGISAAKVHEIFVADTKLNISPYYLRPGGAFGGSCLPKDVRALQYISSDVGGQTHIIDSILRSNDAHKHYLFEHVRRDIAPGDSVLMLGLSFKAGSDDLRESPKVDLARKLIQGGYKLSIYEPSLTLDKLVGQNLGYSFTQLPQMRNILVDRAQAESGSYDLVVDTDRYARHLQLGSAPVVDIARFA